MQLVLALHILSFLVLRTLCFEEGMDNAKHHSKRISAISRQERDKNWFNNLMAQGKEAPVKNLRSAQGLNPTFPNIREMLYGVNVLRGEPPYEKRGTRKILNFDHTDNIDNIEHLDVNRDHTCTGGSTESDVSYAYSEESFTQQTSSTAFGIGVEFELGVPGLTTSAQIALAFSKSKITGSLEKSALKTTSYSFYSYGEKTSYTANLHWDLVPEEAYDPNFLSDCVGLGENPSDADVAQFFNRYGTHGFKRATFGKRCTSLMTTETRSTKKEVETWATTDKSIELKFFWFHSERANKQEDTFDSTEEYNFEYASTDNRCYGKVTDNLGCESLHPIDEEEIPEILHWEYIPIWKMNIPGLTEGAENKMIQFMQSVSKEIESCGVKNCDSHGVCPVSGTVGANFNDMIDSSICICNESYEGISCMETDVVRNFALTGKTYGPTDARNAIDNNKNTHTTITPAKELLVDLKGLIKIERIVIWNGNSIFSNGSLEILDEDRKVVKSESFTSASASDKFDLKDFFYDNIGHFVRIKTLSTLSIAEVQVYGQKLRKLHLTKCTQSSTERKFDAGKAADGNHDTFSLTLKNKKKPFWMVKLQKEESIQKIVVHSNNKDQENYEVQILDKTESIQQGGKGYYSREDFTFDNVHGTYVKITKKKGRISLAEVEVYVL